MGRTARTEPQCLYSTAIPLLPLWAVRPVRSLSACTRVHFTFTNQDEGTTFLPNVGNRSPNGIASHTRRHNSWKPSHTQLYLQTPGNTKAGEDSGGSVGNLFRLRTATNHGTAGVTGKFTPYCISVVFQVKTSYQLQKLFWDYV